MSWPRLPVAPGKGRPIGHEARILIQPMLDEGLIVVLGMGNCGNYFAVATEKGRRAHEGRKVSA